MTPDEFWHGDVWLAEVYRKAYRLKQMEQNNTAWLNGLYVYSAVGSVAARLGGNRTAKYMNKPMDISKTEKKTETTAEQEIAAVTSFLEAMMDAAVKKENGSQG